MWWCPGACGGEAGPTPFSAVHACAYGIIHLARSVCDGAGCSGLLACRADPWGGALPGRWRVHCCAHHPSAGRCCGAQPHPILNAARACGCAVQEDCQPAHHAAGLPAGVQEAGEPGQRGAHEGGGLVRSRRGAVPFMQCVGVLLGLCPSCCAGLGCMNLLGTAGQGDVWRARRLRPGQPHRPAHSPSHPSLPSPKHL